MFHALHAAERANSPPAMNAPPRMRELLNLFRHEKVFDGITPACAGITVKPFCTCTGVRDHPRVCGNYPARVTRTVALEGSPPRVRELRDARGVPEAPQGITPACAGITWAVFERFPSKRDHPRVCGNYRFPFRDSSHKTGSPPRVRELRVEFVKVANRIRITPACAGITPLPWKFLPIVQDHPRVCGNYASIRRLYGRKSGSPPRVRELPEHSV